MHYVRAPGADEHGARFGDLDEAFGKAHLVLEDDYSFHGSTHAAIEPHGTVARYDGAGRYTLWSATQAPRHVQRGVARALDVAESSIRVIPTAVGGGTWRAPSSSL